jgi:hypothetical protein
VTKPQGDCREINTWLEQMHRRTVAPEKPRAAATATLRIEALAAEPLAKPFGVRSIGKAENADRRCHTVFDSWWPLLTMRSPTPLTP